MKEFETKVERELEYSVSIVCHKIKIQIFIDKLKCGEIYAAVVKQHGNNTNLPRNVLDKFDGDIKKFHELWPLFEATVHDNASLPKIEKFNNMGSFLTSSLAKAIFGLILNNENCDTAVEILKDRFGKKQAVITAYMNTILILQPIRRIKDTLELRNLYHDINSIIRSLESFEIDIDSYSNLLYPILNRCILVELMLLLNRGEVGRQVKNLWYRIF